MNMSDVKKHAKNFLRDNYGMVLNIPIKRNNRLSRAMGRFIHTERKPVAIDLAGSLLDYNERETILDVLEHELVHYALFSKGLPYHDGDDYFEESLKELGISATNTTGMYKPLHFLTCGCETTIHVEERLAEHGWICRGCDKELSHIGRYIDNRSNLRKKKFENKKEIMNYISQLKKVN